MKGSPRERGNSATLADHLASGAVEAGAQVESIYLHSLDIRPCDAFDLCKEPGSGCVIEDDMQPLYPKLAAADAIVLASPIYWFTFSAQLKLCMDRWYAFQSSQWQELQDKPFGIILTYGYTDLYTSGGINAIHTFESMVRFLHGKLAGIVHASLDQAGEAEQQPALLEQAFQLGQMLARGKNERV
ncbi:MAG: flavodoxin family protein [Anaerolineales bacterium]